MSQHKGTSVRCYGRERISCVALCSLTPRHHQNVAKFIDISAVHDCVVLNPDLRVDDTVQQRKLSGFDPGNCLDGRLLTLCSCMEE